MSPPSSRVARPSAICALDPESGASINVQIAADILTCDGRFVHGEGRSPDGQYAEPSLIAWNLTREEAISMGSKARQDAIFEIDDTTVTFVPAVPPKLTAALVVVKLVPVITTGVPPALGPDDGLRPPAEMVGTA